jgi:hypothetical protein
MRYVPYGRLGPFVGLGFTLFIRGHSPVCGLEVAREDVRPHESLDEATDLVAADDLMKTRVDLLVDGDRELLLHTYKIRIPILDVKGSGERTSHGPKSVPDSIATSLRKF